jgi:hypothetical protein
MERGMNVAWESFHRATNELASSASIKHILTAAFSNHLKDLEPDSLPPELRPRFEELHASLSRVRPLRGETAVWATVRKMSNDEAEIVARRIVELLGELARHREQLPKTSGRPVLSLYAADG